MGSDRFYPDEAPVREAPVESFRIDQVLVTNVEFGRFVDATGYRTFAEIAPDPADYPGMDPALAQPGSLVFESPERVGNLSDVTQWWRWRIGADWRHPLGPASNLDGLEDHPCVHVAYADAEAYATWAGKALPTEAEWEYAARGGLRGADYAWGDELAPGGAIMANIWQGAFPVVNDLTDGWSRTSPVRSFPPNGYGLFDMIGNVWEWTKDWYAASAGQGLEDSACCAVKAESYDPADPGRSPRRVVKGGSHLCAPNYCRRYRPAARHPEAIDTTTSHIGFRCVVRDV